MANKNERNPGSIAGKWYVDQSCIDCDLCRESVPGIFDRNPDAGGSIVIKQPESTAEVDAALKAKEQCPSDSIGNDGE